MQIGKAHKASKNNSLKAIKVETKTWCNSKNKTKLSTYMPVAIKILKICNFKHKSQYLARDRFENELGFSATWLPFKGKYLWNEINYHTTIQTTVNCKYIHTYVYSTLIYLLTILFVDLFLYFLLNSANAITLALVLCFVSRFYCCCPFIHNAQFSRYVLFLLRLSCEFDKKKTTTFSQLKNHLLSVSLVVAVIAVCCCCYFSCCCGCTDCCCFWWLRY